MKRRITPDTRDLLRRKQGRLRWIYKYRQARSFGRTLGERPGTLLRHVLFDPEVANFTYAIENENEIAAFVANAVAAPLEQIRTYFDEAKADPELTTELDRRLRWRWDMKHHLELGGRLGWYGLARAIKPRTVIETGIHDGLGSLVLLRALKRNAEEGEDGRLISLDFIRRAGWLVPAYGRQRWTPIHELTLDALEDVVRENTVELLVQDLGEGYESEMFDYETVARHTEGRVVLLGAGTHMTTALCDFARARGLEYADVMDRARDHVYDGVGIGIVTIEGSS